MRKLLFALFCLFFAVQIAYAYGPNATKMLKAVMKEACLHEGTT